MLVHACYENHVFDIEKLHRASPDMSEQFNQSMCPPKPNCTGQLYADGMQKMMNKVVVIVVHTFFGINILKFRCKVKEIQSI